ncbi:ribosome biogenesis GTP-binding protein YihA/YsxC [Thiomicrorhabdus sp. ZW0627]|uniref:ribosome biogenesis GTP-binding protein YihA/YsxC n=1 Tax=Thiomicrorhabdus sp. ZW0627 TaxID=3039774 RepID=UPI0024374514|nr:ribosome biogenesis GTP-binding protein YihA/YsxC [Thiomicrorhabdus sp. ZW0627]MDG6774237.1 ribosome biogenesis GTP-binding protein YihA/YsxC [Thiomicrorhabdus sp. ZW0627]
MQHPLYQKATYLKSVPTLALCPEDIGYEVAFAGRSNAGKSSALNVITSQKALARTSKTPGRTQLINFFECDPERRLVDLPGYGFAKVNIKIKRAWEAGLSEYIEKRQCLKGLILLMDSRMPPTDIDLVMLDWTLDLNLPVHVLLTKSDKLKKGPAKANLMKLQKLLKENYPHATAQLFSSLKRDGLIQVWNKLDEWMAYERPVKENKDDKKVAE